MLIYYTNIKRVDLASTYMGITNKIPLRKQSPIVISNNQFYSRAFLDFVELSNMIKIILVVVFFTFMNSAVLGVVLQANIKRVSTGNETSVTPYLYKHKLLQNISIWRKMLQVVTNSVILHYLYLYIIRIQFCSNHYMSKILLSTIKRFIKIKYQCNCIWLSSINN